MSSFDKMREDQSGHSGPNVFQILKDIQTRKETESPIQNHWKEHTTISCSDVTDLNLDGIPDTGNCSFHSS